MNMAYWIHQGTWLLALGAAFALLSRQFALKPVGRLATSIVPHQARTDLVYWFVFPLLYGVIQTAMLSAGLLAMSGGDETAADTYFLLGNPHLRSLPLWVQALAVLVISDVIMYWSHRAFHRGRLWSFHAIHHAPTEVTWLTCVRFHPLNVAFYSIAANVLVVLIGFSPMTLVVLAPFNIIWSALVHANLNWDFGPFRYVLASPVFHRWHHSDVVLDKNFAATFPVLDLMFGTFYMPRDSQPLTTGTPHDPVPDTVWGQLAYPFFPGWYKNRQQNLPHGAQSPTTTQ